MKARHAPIVPRGRIRAGAVFAARARRDTSAHQPSKAHAKEQGGRPTAGRRAPVARNIPIDTAFRDMLGSHALGSESQGWRRIPLITVTYSVAMGSRIRRTVPTLNPADRAGWR